MPDDDQPRPKRLTSAWDRTGLGLGVVALVALGVGLVTKNGPLVIGGFLALFISACMLGLAF